MNNNEEKISLQNVQIDPRWALRINPAIAMRRLALPICKLGDELVVAMADGNDKQTIAAIEAAAGLRVRTVIAEQVELRQALLRVYGDARSGAADTATAIESSDDPVAIVDAFVRAAVIRQASDIHVEPTRTGLRIRFRVDGVLEEFATLPQSVQAAVCSRIKVLAGLDIAEKRAAQDGSFTWLPPATGNSRSKVRPYDVRVATLPVRYGERITMRLLETGNSRIQLNDLGLCDEHNAQLTSVLARPHGLVLLTGPTGSGKTTTLYAAIQHLLETASLNILTVEDPIEYETEGISQVEVDSSDKVNFAKALRSLLRHDPDVVMIGEIRDAESLDAAVKAALTGHLVLSTLHTNDAPSAVTRLRDMGLEPHLIAATLRLSVAQRLVRRLCPECAEKYALTQAEANSLGRPELVGSDAYKPCGCLACSGRGYVGRVGLFEFMLPTAKLSEQIAADAPLGELIAQMKEEKQRLLIDDAIAKIQAGVTTVAEAMTAIDSGR